MDDINIVIAGKRSYTCRDLSSYMVWPRDSTPSVSETDAPPIPP